MSLMKLLKGAGAGIGLGAGTMYLTNEEKGGTFTSYPRDARYKRLLRGEQVPLPGLEDYVYGEGEYSQTKDRFGFGTENDSRQRTDQDEQYSKDNVRGMLDSAKVVISQGQPLPNDLRQSILNIPTKSKELYGGFFSVDEDFAEEVDTLQSYARGDFKQRDDGRFVWGSLLLDRGETPEQYVLGSYPHKLEN